MRVLITGGGMVGSHAAQELAKHDHKVTILELKPDHVYIETITTTTPVRVIQGNVGDIHALLELLQSEQIEAVVHTAALIGQKAETNPYLAFRVNAEGTAAVAEACRLANVQRLVCISSLAVYNWGMIKPSDVVAETAPFGPSSVYGSTKAAAETIVQAYHTKGWIEAIILRLAGVYGFGHFRGGSRLGFILQQTLAQSLKGLPVALHSSLGTNEYLYARDAATAIRLAVEASHRNIGPYNIGTGRVHTPAEVATAVKLTIRGASIDAGTAGRLCPPLNVQRAVSELSFKAQFNLSDGIADLVPLLSQHVLTRSEVTINE